MSDQHEKNLSAQVIVKPASGQRLPPEAITSENVHLTMPAAADFQKARDYFASLGFEVDAGYANSFSITGAQKLFEKTFAVKLLVNEKRAVKARGENSAETSELKLAELPAEIKKIVETVTFTEPPDFGPGNF